MRHLRWSLPAVVVLALCASSPAAGHESHHGGGPSVVPLTPAEHVERIRHFVELPKPVNPLWGDGEDPCVRLGPRGKFLAVIVWNQVATCTAEVGTVPTTGGGHFCTTYDPPPYYALGVLAQRRCARALSTETAARVRVDGGPWVDLFQPGFTAYTPPFLVHLPADNVWNVRAQWGMVTGYGWNANILNLGVGRHEYITEIQDDGVWYSARHIINIVPRRHSHDD